MKKAKLIKLVTVSGIALLGSGILFVDQASATSYSSVSSGHSGSGVVMTSDPVGGTTDTSTAVPSTGDPVGGTTDSSKPVPSTGDPVGGTTDPSESEPSTGNSEDDESNGASKPTIPQEPSKPVTKPVLDQPIISVTGDQIIGTQDGKVLVQTGSGTQLKDAEEVGGKVQEDGTVSVKKSDGNLEVLPHTGDSKTIVTIVGVILLFLAFWISFKDNIKKYLTIFTKKEEKE